MEFTPMSRLDLQTIEAAADAYAAIHGVTMELDIQENDAPPSGNHPVQQVTLQVIRPMPGRRPRRYSRYFYHPVGSSDLLAHIELEIEAAAREVFRVV